MRLTATVYHAAPCGHFVSLSGLVRGSIALRSDWPSPSRRAARQRGYTRIITLPPPPSVGQRCCRMSERRQRRNIRTTGLSGMGTRTEVSTTALPFLSSRRHFACAPRPEPHFSCGMRWCGETLPLSLRCWWLRPSPDASVSFRKPSALLRRGLWSARPPGDRLDPGGSSGAQAPPRSSVRRPLRAHAGHREGVVEGEGRCRCCNSRGSPSNFKQMHLFI